MKFSILRVDEDFPDLRLRSMHNPEKKDSTVYAIAEGVSSPVSNYSLMAAEGKSDREKLTEDFAMSLSGGMLEKICHRFQDFPRKRLIRNGTGQRHRSDEGTERQDRFRSCRTLVLAW